MAGSDRKITKTLVDALKPGDKIFDAEVKGFGVRCQVKARTYFLQTRIHGIQRSFTIGTHGSPWTADTARKEAKRILGEVAGGASLAVLRSEKKQRLTIRDLGEKYLVDYATLHKKPRSVHSDRSNLQNHIYPVLGDRAVDEITTSDIDSFMRTVAAGKTACPDRALEQQGGSVPRGGKGVANRCRSLLSKMFNLAEAWEWTSEGVNPVKRSKAFPEKPMERYLAGEELDRLHASLTKFEAVHPYAIAAIRMCVLTGARREEILALKWRYIDLDQQMLRLPDSKSGKKTIYLSDAAIDVLQAVPRIEGNPYVFCGAVEGRHLVDLNKPWAKVRKDAGLEDVRIHDLRHTFASMAAAAGVPLQVIGKLLGHKSVMTTQRYAHLADEVAINANALVAERVRGAK